MEINDFKSFRLAIVQTLPCTTFFETTDKDFKRELSVYLIGENYKPNIIKVKEIEFKKIRESESFFAYGPTFQFTPPPTQIFGEVLSFKQITTIDKEKSKLECALSLDSLKPYYKKNEDL